jgi:putative transposase
MLEREEAELSLSTQAELLSLSRSSLYYEPIGPSAKEIAIKHRIDEIYTQHPIYGSRRMTAVLGREGWSISRPTVQSYMRAMGIAGIAPGPNTSQPSPEHKVYPYLLRNLEICRPNQVWGIDITYCQAENKMSTNQELKKSTFQDSKSPLASFPYSLTIAMQF